MYSQVYQWRGPGRDGIFPDTGLLKSWPEEGPELLLSLEGIGRGYSSAVATVDAMYVTGTLDSTEYVTAFSNEGKLLWQQSYGPSWDQSFPDARCTPTVEGDRLYVISAKDRMVCMNRISGKEIWSVDLHQKFQSRWDMFGVSESVLIIDNKVICTPCGDLTTVVALDKYTGETIWQSKPLGVERGNASPVLFTNDTLDLSMIITVNRTHVLGVDPESGEILWTYHYNHLDKNGENVTILANTPLFHYDEIFISDGWDQPSVMLEVTPDGKSAHEKYIDNTLDNQNHGLVRIGDYVYGSNFLTRQFGKWVCMRWDNGEIMWVTDWENKGPVLAADGMLYIMDEKKGNMALVNPDPDHLDVVSSFRVTGGRGPFWARPSIFDQKLVVRHGDVLLVYNLKKS